LRCAFSWLGDWVLTDVVLTNLGEKMSDEEVDELLKAVDTSSGEINYTGMFSCLIYSEWLTLTSIAELVRTILAN
jgi:hypothetical protein